MNQKVEDMASEEIIGEDVVAKQVAEAKADLQEEIKEAKAEEKEEQKKEAKKSDKPEKAKHGKKYLAALGLIDHDKVYSVDEAIDKVLETKVVKFDPTIEVHGKLALAGIRGTIILPAGAPKEKRITVADEKNVDEIVANAKANKIDFDILLATPAVMPKLAAAAKILGPKGMMPSPKSGTVVEDTKAALEEIKSGKVEYKQDEQKNIHLAIAKASWDKEMIKENLLAFIKILPKNKVTGLYLTSSMGPSVKVEIPK
ncbi:MAG: 50S ribosomal protein L1 [Patescibacteria group bacterium]|jgi:large subunit ribosomal protein L1